MAGEEQPAWVLEDEDSNTLPPIELKKEYLKDAISFGINKSSTDADKYSTDPYDLFIIDQANNIAHDYGCNLIKFFTVLFHRTSWEHQVDLGLANKPMIPLDDNDPPVRFFYLFHQVDEPMIAEKIKIQKPQEKELFVQCGSLNLFLKDFPHREGKLRLAKKAVQEAPI